MQLPTESSTTLTPAAPAAPVSSTPKTPAPLGKTPKSRRRVQAGRRAKVLLVEDEEDLRFALKARLTHHGFDVAVALDGVAARCSLLSCRYDAVVLDLGLPKSHGLDVLTDVGERKKLPPVIVLTGGNEHEQGLALMLGAKIVLQKPCSFESLSSAIDSLLSD